MESSGYTITRSERTKRYLGEHIPLCSLFTFPGQANFHRQVVQAPGDTRRRNCGHQGPPLYYAQIICLLLTMVQDIECKHHPGLQRLSSRVCATGNLNGFIQGFLGTSIQKHVLVIQTVVNHLLRTSMRMMGRSSPLIYLRLSSCNHHRAGSTRRVNNNSMPNMMGCATANWTYGL